LIWWQLLFIPWNRYSKTSVFLLTQIAIHWLLSTGCWQKMIPDIINTDAVQSISCQKPQTCCASDYLVSF
jgi:hypothetical protein